MIKHSFLKILAAGALASALFGAAAPANANPYFPHPHHGGCGVWYCGGHGGGHWGGHHWGYGAAGVGLLGALAVTSAMANQPSDDCYYVRRWVISDEGYRVRIRSLVCN